MNLGYRGKHKEIPHNTLWNGAAPDMKIHSSAGHMPDPALIGYDSGNLAIVLIFRFLKPLIIN